MPLMKNCINCNEEFEGRTDKVFCSSYCKSNYHYEKRKEDIDSFYQKVDKQLKKNRRLLKQFNKAGKSTVRKTVLLEEGFNPRFFTHFWKNKKGQVYLFCYEFGFLEIKDNQKTKYVLVQWQDYMRR